MAKFLKIVGALALAGVAMAAFGIGSLVVSQRAEAASSAAPLMHVGIGGRGFCGQAGLEAAAEALGLTADELFTQLWGGRTLADLAEAAGVDLEDVQAAVNAACQQATRDAIEQAVSDGTITREHADWLLEGLDKGFWGGNSGFGIGFGPHGFGGRGFFGVPSTPDSSGGTSGTGFYGGYRGQGRLPFSNNVITTPGSDA